MIDRFQEGECRRETYVVPNPDIQLHIALQSSLARPQLLIGYRMEMVEDQEG